MSAATLIHASPPCQGYSALRHLPWMRDRDYPRLIDEVRDMLQAAATPWVIENVEPAPMPSSTVLCGWTFGLPMYRHRRFESSFLILAPPHRRHETVLCPGSRNMGRRYQQGGGRDLMGLFPGATADDVDMGWMTQRGASQGVPPVYTRFIGEQFLAGIPADTTEART